LTAARPLRVSEWRSRPAASQCSPDLAIRCEGDDCHTEEQARTRAERVNGEVVDQASYVIRADDPLDLNSG